MKAKTTIVHVTLGICILFMTGISSVTRADGGAYSSTLHGDPRRGVERNPGFPPGDCSHCHSMHGGTGEATDFALWTANNNGLCFTCHAGISARETYRGSGTYERSIHEDDFLVRWPGPNPPGRAEPDAKGKCVNCHTPHGRRDDRGLVSSLLIEREEKLCLTCHRRAGPAQKDIDTQLTYQFTHQISDRRMEGRHAAGEEMVPTNFSGQGRHIECEDCHNVHVLTRTRGLPTQGTNRASELLKGVSFIEVNYGNEPDTFPAFQPRDQIFDIQFEYQLCFKCHSYWAYGSFPPPVPSGGRQTDPSIEFNPNNISSHNVIQSPNLNRVGEFVNGWRWDSKMRCSNCHGSDVEQDAEGPHGSQLPFILKAPWNDTTGRRSQNTERHLCFLCHDFSTYTQPMNNRNTGFSSNNGQVNLHGYHAQRDNAVSNRPIACMDCHSSVPHGINRRGLLVTTSDRARYLGGTVLLRESDVPTWGPAGMWRKDHCNVECHY